MELPTVPTMKLYWVSFLDGLQRVILFTEDVAVMMMAQQVRQLWRRYTSVAQCPVLHWKGENLIGSVQCRVRHFGRFEQLAPVRFLLTVTKM